MGKKSVILICVILSIIAGIIGFIVGITLNAKNGKNLVGTYRTNTWNGKEAVIVLQKDKTMIHPMGYKGTWCIDDGKLYIEYEYFDTVAQSADEIVLSFSNESKETNKQKDYTRHVKDEVTIVDSGLMYKGHFFEKLNK